MMSFTNFLNNPVEEYLCCILMFVLSMLLIVQVFFRYCIGQSLTWSEELARYIFVWLVYLGVPYGCLLMRHIKIDAGLMLFPKFMRKHIVLIGEISFFLLAIAVAYYSAAFDYRQYKIGLVSPALKIPMWVIYLAPFVGFSLAAIRQLQVIVKILKNKNSDNNVTDQGVA